MSSEDSWEDDDYKNYNWTLPEKKEIECDQQMVILQNELRNINNDDKLFKLHKSIIEMQLQIINQKPKVVYIERVKSTLVQKITSLLLFYLCLLLTYVVYNTKEKLFFENKIVQYAIFA
tara:strand:- start:480 stop:836 length:357 start_codon:yes stop_codon:yes gene_type:complete